MDVEQILGGQKAMDEASILSEFREIEIHDHWFSYFAYRQITHGLCNSHHLRELTFINEQEKEDWAKRVKDLLIFTKNVVDRPLEQESLPQEALLQIEEKYD